MYALGMDDEHAAPHASGVDAGTVIAADSVIPVVPLYAATVVPDVMPAPEISAPTIGGVVGVVVKASELWTNPTYSRRPEPCDVKIDALPETRRALIGPLLRSATAFAAIAQSNSGLCARRQRQHRGSAVQHRTAKTNKNLFILKQFPLPTVILSHPDTAGSTCPPAAVDAEPTTDPPPPAAPQAVPALPLTALAEPCTAAGEPPKKLAAPCPAAVDTFVMVPYSHPGFRTPVA